MRLCGAVIHVGHVSGKSVFAVKMHYTTIMRCLGDLSEKGEKWSVEANGVIHRMTRVSVIACWIIFQIIFKVIHVIQKGL